MWGRVGPHLQGDPVLYQQANFDVHEIEVLLKLLIGPDLPDHLFLELQQLCFSQEVLLALIQEVGKSPNHTERGVGCVDWEKRGGIRIRHALIRGLLASYLLQR